MFTIAIVAFLALTACSANSSNQATTHVAAGTVKWSNCGGGFQCGTVTVPLDYAHPASGTIDIALNRKPATDPANRIGSVLTNPGGPGASGIQFLQGETASMSSINRRFDLIGFDPRGIGQTPTVRCLLCPRESAYNP